MCSCWWGSVGFVFLACVRVGLRACVWFLGAVRVPRVWCAGCRKAGREPVVWFSPRFSSFCVERTTGLEPAAFTLGGWCSGLLSYVRKRVFPGRSRLFCGLRWGLERTTGLEPAASTLARWCSDLLSYVRVSPRPACLVACFCLPARGASLVPTY